MLCNQKDVFKDLFISDLPSSVRELSLQLWPLREHQKLPFKKLTLQSQGMVYLNGILDTTFQSKMNAKLSPHRFWPCHETGLIETIQTIPHNHGNLA